MGQSKKTDPFAVSASSDSLATLAMNRHYAQNRHLISFLKGCEHDLFVRNNRRANEAVEFRKFFVHIGVAAFE
jgi:hypothetical protein